MLVFLNMSKAALMLLVLRRYDMIYLRIAVQSTNFKKGGACSETDVNVLC
jgi:hypothetical protein